MLHFHICATNPQMIQLKTTVEGRTISTRLHNWGLASNYFGGDEDYCEGFLTGETDDMQYLFEKRPENLELLDEAGNEYMFLDNLKWCNFTEIYDGHAIVYIESHDKQGEKS